MRLARLPESGGFAKCLWDTEGGACLVFNNAPLHVVIRDVSRYAVEDWERSWRRRTQEQPEWFEGWE